jgi:transposase-like protein
MSDSSCIDPLRGRAMPKSYSGDLRERVIEAVEGGASRRETAERFEVSVSSAVKWLQRWHESKSAAPKPRGGSVSPLEAFAEQILDLITQHSAASHAAGSNPSLAQLCDGLHQSQVRLPAEILARPQSNRTALQQIQGVPP